MITEKDGLFHLQTQNTSYIIGVIDGVLLHLYWGKRLRTAQEPDALLPPMEARPFSGSDLFFRGQWVTTEDLPLEYPSFGSADLRHPAFHVRQEDGSCITRPRLVSYEISGGKYALPGLPAAYAQPDDRVQALSLTLCDSAAGVQITLLYGVYDDFDLITRSVRIENIGSAVQHLQSVMSASVDFAESDFDLIHLSGSWARERTPKRAPLFDGTQEIESLRGASSHSHNPFFALVSPNADEETGDAYGFQLVYSGNFIAGSQVSPYGMNRAYIGIHPFCFDWLLNPGESFYAPEALLVYSDSGIGGMSRIYHRLIRSRICRGEFRDAERYVLINNWETTYFQFDEDTLVRIADKAAGIGIDLLVLDDGWFCHRDDDTGGLGDWEVNTQKLPGGLNGLAQRLRERGMKFGLWVEPEMVSPDSAVYRAHPDWCIHTAGQPRTPGRNQLVFDLSRPEVREYIKATLCRVIDSAPIDYIKWDMNRNITEIGSAGWDAAHQGEIYHRYILGLYDILEFLLNRYPHILFEGCSGGGGRFDAGMLYYMPQIWTSDDTDAKERLMIQYGTSLCYPYSAMGAHVSAVPNHQVGRTTPITMRCDVSLPGQFGFELDLTRLTDEELSVAGEKIALYRKLGEIFHRGTLYRLRTPDCGDFCANEFVAEDGSSAVLMMQTIQGVPNGPYRRIRLRGLCADAVYTDGTGRRCTGEQLMRIGLPYRCLHDYDSSLILLKKEIAP